LAIFAINSLAYDNLLLSQRKNGLFKKAYELGVLCSVDVAVIIFGQFFLTSSPSFLTGTSEERAGHHLKLYQYCSGDIHDIIQRHVRVSSWLFFGVFTNLFFFQYDGEKDTKTPHDFVNNANAKLNHDADIDDDEGDDDDDPDSAPTRGSKRRHDPKLKAEYSNNAKLLIPSGGDMGLNVDVRSLLISSSRLIL
jgi:MADS-box transcription factor